MRLNLLGIDAEIEWRMSSKGLEIIPPAELGKSKYAWSFEINTGRTIHTPHAKQMDANKVFEGTH